MLSRFIFSILGICLLPSYFLFGQVVMPSHVYTTHNGLPQIQVMDMMQDSKGYLWVATKKGVARFSGTAWKTFAEAEKYEVSSIIENSKGEIILIPNVSGIGYFFKIVGSELVQSKDQLYDLNSFTTAYKNDTLFHLNVLKSKLQYFDLTTMQMFDEKDIDISKYRLGEYSDEHGLVLIEKSTNKTRNYVTAHNSKNLLQVETISNFLYTTTNGKNIIADQKENHIDLYSFDSFEKIAEVKTKNKKFIDATVFKPEEFYFCDGEYHYLIDEHTEGIAKYHMVNTTRNIFLKDMDGNLWNSSEGGIQFFSKTEFVNYDNNALNDAWFFQPYQDHFIYGNYTGGLKKVHLNPIKIAEVKMDFQNSIYFDPSLVGDKLYIPGSNYISVYNKGQLEMIDIKEGNTPLLCSYADQSSGKVYFGGLKSTLELSENHSYQLYTDEGEVFSRYVLAIESFDDDNLIFGTKTDLVLFNKNTHKFKALNHLFPANDKHGAISLVKDHKDNIWIGNNSGLWHYEIAENRIEKIAAELIDKNVISLIQAKENILAIGTSKELMYLNLEEFYKTGNPEIKTFNFNNGFKGEELGQNGFELVDSILWIPSATKLISTNVNDFEFTETYTSVEISAVNGQLIDESNYVDKPYDMTFGVGDLKVDFNAIGFNLPSLSQFQYKLEGKDLRWSNWTEENEAYFRQLGSGEYTFKVRTKAGSTIGAKSPEKSVKLKVDLPFFKEPDFYKNALYFSLFLIGLIGVLLYSISNRITAKRELDKQFKLLQVQTLQLQLNPHFLFNVLGSIQSLILAKDFENANTYLVSFSKMIRRYLDYNVSAYKSLQSDSKDAIKISLQEELDIIKIYLEFERLQLGNKFSYTYNIDSTIDTNEVRVPPLIIQPLLENAIKHGVVPKKEKSNIELKIQLDGTGVMITILDDGIGIARSTELQKKSMKEFKSQSLELINQRIEVLNSLGENISLEIRDVKGVGVEQHIFIDQNEFIR